MHEGEPRLDPLPRVWAPDDRIGDMLKGRRGLVVGIANEHSIAFGCAAVLRALGADIAVTYLNEKAEPFVRPLAEQLEADLCLPLDVEKPGELEAVFDAIRSRWGRLDFLVHSIAYAPRKDLHGRVIDVSAEGFAQAMRVSCWSFLRMAHLAEPLMTEGGTLLTMSYYGSEKVVENYNIMGPVKAALEAAVRYAARTRAASGIAQFDELIEKARQRAPQHRLVDIAEVGRVCAFLVSPASSGMTGDTIYVDAGLHNVA
jgi:enoyl-[acyl-carrier protein] reductase I